MSYAENVSAFAVYRAQINKEPAKKRDAPKKPSTPKKDIIKTPIQKLSNGFGNHVDTLDRPAGKLSKNAKRKLKNKIDQIPDTPPKETPRNIPPVVTDEIPTKKRNISEQSIKNTPPKKKEKSEELMNDSTPKKKETSEELMNDSTPKKKGKTEDLVNNSTPKNQDILEQLQEILNKSNPKNQVVVEPSTKSSPAKKKQKPNKHSQQQNKPKEEKRFVQSTAGKYVSYNAAKDNLKSTIESDPPTNDSIEDGKDIFRWLVSPVDFDEFFEKYWEKNPCLIQRNDPAYFSKLISCSVIDQMLLNNHVEFTKNIDITSYVDGVRDTLNPEGRAMPSVVWGHYEDGCSIRLLNPQTFIQPIYVMNATLQEFFHCMVGTNVYLTPPNSQGFAPHYDDIEAFVIQIEGQKRWKLYNPRTNEEALARFSSPNFAQKEIGQPILDKVLKPGDVLYFPRGTIHQASTQPGYHSLHITISMYQKHSYADLFEIILPKMISRAIKSELDLRRGVPLGIWQNLGKIFTGDEEYTNEREEIMEKCEKLMHKVLRYADLDEGVDLMAKRFHHDALPPALTPTEKERTIFGAKTDVDNNGHVQYGYNITLDSHVRLIRANVLRVVEEEDSIRLYYYVDNSKEYHEYEPNFIEIEEESVGIVQQLVKEYPEYICISELEAELSDDDKVSVVQGLFERGLLMVDEPSSS